MNFSRKKSRKLLFQKLYSLTFNDLNEVLFNEAFFEWVFTFEIDTKYIDEMIKIILKNEDFLIFIVRKYSPKFDIKTMNIVYILPILIWLAEMFFLNEEIPAKVSINEAVELSKTYWSDSAKKIVNWLLNKVYENFDELKEIWKNFVSNIENEKIFKKFS